MLLRTRVSVGPQFSILGMWIIRPSSRHSATWYKISHSIYRFHCQWQPTSNFFLQVSGTWNGSSTLLAQTILKFKLYLLIGHRSIVKTFAHPHLNFYELGESSEYKNQISSWLNIQIHRYCLEPTTMAFLCATKHHINVKVENTSIKTCKSQLNVLFSNLIRSTTYIF